MGAALDKSLCKLQEVTKCLITINQICNPIYTLPWIIIIEAGDDGMEELNSLA